MIRSQKTTTKKSISSINLMTTKLFLLKTITGHLKYYPAHKRYARDLQVLCEIT